MPRKKAEVALDDMKNIIRNADKCRDIQEQILDYCIKLKNKKEPIDKNEISEELRSIVIWGEDE